MQITRLTLDQFPYMLRKVPKPPAFLDCAGALPPSEDYIYLCVVGARKFDNYGKEACTRLIQGLKGFPIVIVSGLAIGIDSIAHEAALDVGLKTIAFPGSGLDKHSLYPYRHWALAERIVTAGSTLLSPFERDMGGAPWTFPVRNELMAGSCQATLLIQGRHGSGTLLTADHALQFDRDVLIVPGPIFSELSYGPHKLYKEGAIPVTNSKEVLAALGFNIDFGDGSYNDGWKNIDIEEANSELVHCGFSDRQSTKKQPAGQLSIADLSLSEEERLIIRLLQYSPLCSSDLISKTSLNAAKLNIILSELELRGLIRQEGQVYMTEKP